MVEFKKKADEIIKQTYGLEVEHICATSRERERVTYEKQFYTKYKSRRTSSENASDMYGFPRTIGAWCNSRLKIKALSQNNIREMLLSDTSKEDHSQRTGNLQRVPADDRELVYKQAEDKVFSQSSLVQGADINIVQYLGIAADEPIRISRHKDKPGIALPLVDIGWDEAYCRQWCEERDLLSPIYTTATRGGCWFCHNQGVDQLRLLRKNYPELWELLLKWDKDSPTSFKSDGHTVHDFEKRFSAEDSGLLDMNKRFRWSYVL